MYMIQKCFLGLAPLLELYTLNKLEALLFFYSISIQQNAQCSTCMTFTGY